MKTLGADEVVDHATINIPEHLKVAYFDQQFDIIVDTIGSGDIFRASSM